MNQTLIPATEIIKILASYEITAAKKPRAARFELLPPVFIYDLAGWIKWHLKRRGYHRDSWTCADQAIWTMNYISENRRKSEYKPACFYCEFFISIGQEEAYWKAFKITGTLPLNSSVFSHAAVLSVCDDFHLYLLDPITGILVRYDKLFLPLMTENRIISRMDFVLI